MQHQSKTKWDKEHYHGRYNKYPFTEVVSFVMRTYGNAEDRTKIRILDLGCGGAHHLLFLAKEGFDYYGIDGATESIQIATEVLKKNNFDVSKLRVGTFEDLPYEDNFFDCVIDRGSLICNRIADLSPIIDQIHRVMKPGGKCFNMMLHETNSIKNGARSLGNNDYMDFTGRLKGANVLHFTNSKEVQTIFSKFTINNIELSSKVSEYAPTEVKNIDAWMITTCTK